MAKKTTPPKSQTVAFVGKFGYRDMHRAKLEHGARAAGWSVISADGSPDYLVAGEGRGGKPPGDVAKVEKRHPAVVVVEIATFAQLVLPEPAALVREIKAGRHEHDWWDAFDGLCSLGNTSLDLKGTDLRGADLYAGKLEHVALDGADLRKANVQYTHFADLRDVKFDEVDGPNVYLRNLSGCSFRKANLSETWMFWGGANRIENCDFSAAQMAEARIEGGVVADCVFRDALLSDAQLERTTFERADFTGTDLSRAHLAHARLEGAKLTNTVLVRADLRHAVLKDAHLRGADLRNAVLNDADLTGADITGANLEGAVLTGVNLTGVDVTQAKNFVKPVARVVGPKVQEFAAAASGAKSFTTSAEVDLGTDEFAKLNLSLTTNGARIRLHASSHLYRSGDDTYDHIAASTFEDGLLNLRDRWPNAVLRLDSIAATGSKSVRGKALLTLAIAAWAEVFGVPLDQLGDTEATQRSAALKKRDDLVAALRTQGVAAWDAIDYREKERYELRGVDLSGANLPTIRLASADLREAKFAGATLSAAEFWSSKFHTADFSGADLSRAEFQGSVCEKTLFVGADLRDANFRQAKLIGADFTDAILTDTLWEKAHFDETTRFPVDFVPPLNMHWKGKGARPGVVPVKRAQVGSVDFPAFMTSLAEKVDAGRMKNAVSMLKSEKFQLFSDVTDSAMLGVVKSQSSKDLVYSCRLASDGTFGCCTQNLRPCGGLRGALCKHLLVLVVGLTKAGRLDPATVAGWIDMSRSMKPAIDADGMSETLLKFKGAEAGEIDWRPTETLPEDFYAM